MSLCSAQIWLQDGELKHASRTVTLFDLLPSVKCVSPRQLQAASGLQSEECSQCGVHVLCDVHHVAEHYISMDMREFKSPGWQRVYQYLCRHIEGKKLDSFSYTSGSVEGTVAECLQVLLR